MSTKQIPPKNEAEKQQMSICDLAKANTSEIIQKMEYQIPVYLQGYTDLFTKYLHLFNTSFGTCRISEKQFFDKVGIDHSVITEISEYWNFVRNLSIVQIESYSKFIESYIEFRVDTIDIIDKSMNTALDYYLRFLLEFDKK